MALFHCARCAISRHVPDHFAGKKARCPSCRDAITIIPDESNATAEPDSPNATDTTDASHSRPPHQAPAQDVGTQQGSPQGATSGGTASTALPPSSFQVDVGTTPAPARTLLYGGTFHNLFSGLESGILLVLFCLTFSLLIHQAAPGASSLSALTGMALVSCAIFCLIMSLRGRLPVLAAGPETATCCILFLFAGFVQNSAADITLPQARATLVAGFILTALAVGIAAQLAARLNLGRVLRYIPPAITGGLLAAVGVILVRAAVDMGSANSFCLATLLPDMNVPFCLRWLPAVLFGAILCLLLYRSKNALLNITLLVLATLGVHILLWQNGMPLAQGQQTGHLVPFFFPSAPWQTYSLGMINDIRWDILLNGLPYLSAAIVLIILSLPDKAYSLELLLEDDVDINDLLRNVALANTVSALAGGLPGSLSINRCVSAQNSRRRGPLAGITAAALCIAALVWAGPFTGYVPTIIPAGLLAFFGLSLLRTWLIDTRRSFTRTDDYALLVLIFLISLVFGLLAGMASGFLLTMLLLARRNSDIPVIRNTLSGSTHHSRVDREAQHFAALRQRGDEILILRLQGFLFLGATRALIEATRLRLGDVSRLPLRYLILDFSQVTGLAARVALGFTRLGQIGRAHGFRLIFANMPLEVGQQLEATGYALNAPDGSTLSFMDADYALEWCEDRILSEAGMDETEEKGLTAMLAPIFPEPALLPRLMPLLERRAVGKREIIFKQGDVPKALYLIESGMVTIQLELEGGKTTRVVKMGPGTVFGEMGLYTQAPRSATAVADSRCVLYSLPQDTLRPLQENDPELLSALHRFVVTLLSRRVYEANTHVADLLR